MIFNLLLFLPYLYRYKLYKQNILQDLAIVLQGNDQKNSISAIHHCFLVPVDILQDFQDVELLIHNKFLNQSSILFNNSLEILGED